MKTPLLLRITSIFMFLFAAGHSLWSPMGETDVLRAMRSVSFQIGGVTRTYLDFYTGFGRTLSIFLLLQAVLLWQMATIASAVVSWTLILAIPVIFSAVVGDEPYVSLHFLGADAYATK